MKNIFLSCTAIFFLLASVPKPSMGEVGMNASEPEQIRKFAAFAKRDGETLRLRLESGFYLTLTDKQGCSNWETCTLYTFVDYLKDAGFYVVFIRYYEGYEYLMVSDKTGKQFLIPELPKISPDRKRLVAVSADDSGYNENGVFIWRFEGDEIVSELTYKPSAPPVNEYALYGFKEWKDNKTVFLIKFARSGKRLCPDSDFMTLPVILRMEAEEWRFSEVLSPDAVKCEPK
jgi:hypothetical protein